MAIRQFNPPHPGEMIERTYIEPFKEVTAANIARELGVSKSTLSRLLAGKSDVSPEMAVRLSAVLGRSAESWLLMQDNYDLWKAREVVDADQLERIDFSQVA
ncbi:HigA family addiction module antitoxin [Candidatus Vondammii sp. HM_W22]|uniref:HigA family addiction module antitoxin n=1 Tax=Candidatus Vondammii sp. HM_W22 TaxID=2687299 RepID=UPI001F12A40C|nr:HigA family addiction module antitoxin [Candidatus Vondammii sp. HM_W22]